MIKRFATWVHNSRFKDVHMLGSEWNKSYGYLNIYVPDNEFTTVQLDNWYHPLTWYYRLKYAVTERKVPFGRQFHIDNVKVALMFDPRIAPDFDNYGDDEG